MRRSKQGSDPPGDGGKKGTVRKLAGYALAAACLIWVFYNVNPSRLLKSITDINWGWIVLAVACDVLGYCSQGAQWTLLLHPFGKVRFLKAVQAIYAGLFTNEMLPMRAGELVRIFLVSRWLSVDFMSVVPSVAVGRLFDGIWLVVGIGLTAVFVHLPEELREGIEILGVAVLAGILLLFYVILFAKGTVSVDAGDKEKKQRGFPLVLSWIGKTAQGIRAIGLTRHFYLSFAVSALYLFFGIMAFWLGTRAYGLDLFLWAGAAAYLIVRVGIFIPNAPSNLGTYQFFTVFALTLLGVDKTDAAGFSVIFFVILTIPSLVIGLFAISRAGMKFRDIRREIGNLIKRNPSS